MSGQALNRRLHLNVGIKLKLLMSYLVLLFLLIAFVLIYVPNQLQRQLERELNNKLRDMTEMLAIGVGVSLATGDNEIFRETVNWVKNDQDLAYIIVLDEEGDEIISHNGELLTEPVERITEKAEILTIGDTSFLASPIEHEEMMLGHAIVGLSWERLNREIDENRSTFIVVSLVILILGTTMVWILSNLLGGPIVEMKDIAIRIADGETDVSVPVRAGGEIGDLAQAFRTMLENLRTIVTQAQRVARGDLAQGLAGKGDLADAFNQMVGDLSQLVRQVQEAGKRIDTYSAQMSQAITGQTSTASEQSASITQTATTMQELARTSEEMTQNSNRVVEAAQGTQRDAQQGVQALEQILEHMGGIKLANERSLQEIESLSAKVKQIGSVMDVINGITDQTKLIAFNASIEAVAAGEAGKRFGVVAQEVRRLADTVVEATDDIRLQIGEIQQATSNLVSTSQENTRTIEGGMESATATTGSLEQILGSVSTTAEAIDQISSSIEGQKEAVDQIMLSLNEISTGAQNFAGSVEETNEVAGDLSGLSKELTSLIGRFKVDRNEVA
jgi:methyl-accepting chemotaxis protein